MVDIHCHILPGVDDGADSLSSAVEMARMAAESGVDAIIATPHCNLPYNGENHDRSAAVAEQVSQLNQAIRAAQIPLTVYPGCEVLCTPEVPALLAAHKLLPLSGGRYVLLEFFSDEDPDEMDNLLRTVSALGYTPVIAHPERYEAVQHLPQIVRRWFQSGYIIQLNKGSILGRLGRRSQHTAHRLLSLGLVHVVASDAHSPQIRTPALDQLYHCLSDRYSIAYADVLLEQNPRRILENRPILQPDEF